MDKSELSKIVSTPNETSWSQAYNAGKLYAVLALEREVIEQEVQVEGELDLNLIGKETLETLESEFFTLETKDLEGIKGAVERACEKLAANIKASLVVAAESTNILYVVIKGRGKVDLKRGGQIGTVLESDEENEIKTGSGFLQNNDVLILQTPEFSELVSKDILAQSIDNQSPSEIAEILAPTIHQSDKGGAASVILKYKDETPPEAQEVPQAPLEETEAGTGLKIINDYFFQVKNLIQERRFEIPSLPHSKRVLLTIGLILILVFAGTVILAAKKQGDKKVKEAYVQVYVEAQEKYEEGQSLLDLNKALARDSFTSAKKILEEGQSRFSKGSKEEKQVEELLSKVNLALSESSGVARVSPVEVSKSESKLLSFALEHKDGLYFTKDDKNLYVVSKTSVSSDKKVLIKNSGDWTDAGGLGTFFGNIYVLDRPSDQIVKFLATPSDFGKANYFTKEKPDLSNAQAMAIDGSIYILFKDGTILKYTKGTRDSFEVKGLDKALSNPTRIFTDSQSNIYVLDNGNSRIVVIGKDGRYQSQYQANILKDAKDFDVQESSKKIFILVGSKIYRIDLK